MLRVVINRTNDSRTQLSNKGRNGDVLQLVEDRAIMNSIIKSMKQEWIGRVSNIMACSEFRDVIEGRLLEII